MSEFLSRFFTKTDAEKWARVANIVFVVGYPRSGTTLLARTLINHPFFASINLPAESNLFIRPEFLLLFSEELEKIYSNYLDEKDMECIHQISLTKTRKAMLKYLPESEIRKIFDEMEPSMQKQIRLLKKGLTIYSEGKNRNKVYRKRGYDKLIKSFFIIHTYYITRKEFLKKHRIIISM